VIIDNLYSPTTGRASKKKEKELNYILTKVDANIYLNFNIRRLTGSSKLKDS